MPPKPRHCRLQIWRVGMFMRKIKLITQFIKIPRISNPKELVDVKFIDHGDTLSPDGVFTSEFIINGKSYLSQSNRTPFNQMNYRYSQDHAFLRKHDLSLERAIFEDA